MSMVDYPKWTLEEIEFNNELIQEFETMDGDYEETLRLLKIQQVKLQKCLLEGNYEQVYRQADKRCGGRGA